MSDHCPTCGAFTGARFAVGKPDSVTAFAAYAPTVAATHRLAEALLAAIPPDPQVDIELRRAVLVAAVLGRPESDIEALVENPGPGRPRLVNGVWRWSAA